MIPINPSSHSCHLISKKPYHMPIFFIGRHVALIKICTGITLTLFYVYSQSHNFDLIIRYSFRSQVKSSCYNTARERADNKTNKLLFYMRISPKYSLAPSPFPLLAFGLAYLTELFAFIVLIMAPGCSTGSFPAL